jgi:hypothetical protein
MPIDLHSKLANLNVSQIKGIYSNLKTIHLVFLASLYIINQKNILGGSGVGPPSTCIIQLGTFILQALFCIFGQFSFICTNFDWPKNGN